MKKTITRAAIFGLLLFFNPGSGCSGMFLMPPPASETIDPASMLERELKKTDSSISRLQLKDNEIKITFHFAVEDLVKSPANHLAVSIILDAADDILDENYPAFSARIYSIFATHPVDWVSRTSLQKLFRMGTPEALLELRRLAQKISPTLRELAHRYAENLAANLLANNATFPFARSFIDSNIYKKAFRECFSSN